jgi:hypothetical protein
MALSLVHRPVTSEAWVRFQDNEGFVEEKSATEMGFTTSVRFSSVSNFTNAPYLLYLSTVRPESSYTLTRRVRSDIHELIYRPEPF